MPSAKKKPQRRDPTTLARQIGEYPIVVRNSRDPVALLAASRARLSVASAQKLVGQALKPRHIPFELHFGRSDSYCWGGIRNRPRIGYLSLVGGGEALNAATVLHEVAHVIGMWTSTANGHQPAFTRIYDQLIAELPWRRMIRRH